MAIWPSDFGRAGAARGCNEAIQLIPSVWFFITPRPSCPVLFSLSLLLLLCVCVCVWECVCAPSAFWSPQWKIYAVLIFVHQAAGVPARQPVAEGWAAGVAAGSGAALWGLRLASISFLLGFYTDCERSPFRVRTKLVLSFDCVCWASTVYLRVVLVLKQFGLILVGRNFF